MKKQLKMLVILLVLTIAIPSVVNTTKAQDQATVSVDSVSVTTDPIVVLSPAEILDSGLYYVKNVPEKGSSPDTWIKWIYGLVGLVISGVIGLVAYFKARKKK